MARENFFFWGQNYKSKGMKKCKRIPQDCKQALEKERDL